MKKISTSLFLLIFLCSIQSSLFAQSLSERLFSISQVKSIEKLQSDHFAEKYLLKFEQPIDHKNPSLGTFTQRVFVCHVDTDSSTVMETEGYGAQYPLWPRYTNELARLFNTNIVVVEHRYFLESTPRGKDWQYLTTENSACDLHNIFTALKQIYPKKWIASGTSKGGQTTTLYRTYFPNDVDISVPYVAPLCRGVEDGRHEPFIANCPGTPEDRARVKDFQMRFLQNKAAILPMLDSLTKVHNYSFRLPLNEIYDYWILEYPFAFWQYGSPVDKIPSNDATPAEMFKYLEDVSGPDYLIEESIYTSFHVQAAKELGYYGYDIEPYKEYLDVKSTKGYMKTLFLPKDGEFTFDDTLYKLICNHLKTSDSKMLFIYGEFDPWSAVMVEDPHRDNIKVYVLPGGCHSARISIFPEETKKEIIDTLNRWLYAE